MAHGVVPVASAVSRIPQVLESIGAGRTAPVGDLDAFRRAVVHIDDPELWSAESEQAARSATAFTYESYLTELSELLSTWHR